MLYRHLVSLTGKTVYIKNELTQKLEKSMYRTIMMTFSAQTNANQTQVSPPLQILSFFSYFQVNQTTMHLMEEDLSQL